MMLSKVVNFKDSTLLKDSGNIILIRDSLGQSGRALVKSLIRSLVRQVDELHIFLTELNMQHIMSGLWDSSESKIICHDLVADMLGIGSSNNLDLDSIASSCTGKVGVVFDSVSGLILDRSPAYTCQVLTRLARADKHTPGLVVHTVLGLVHQDLHPSPVLTQLTYITDISLTVHSSVDDRYSARCCTLVKKPGGKVVKSDELYQLTPGFQLVRADPVSSAKHKTVSLVAEEQPDPAANLTFNLRLTASEEQARSQLQLPYTLDQQRKAAELGSAPAEVGTAPGGKVFYLPDDTDDWDEDDPDDDLDI